MISGQNITTFSCQKTNLEFFVPDVRTAETSFFVNDSINRVWYISLGEYKEFSIHIARKLNNIHNMCNLFFYYQCCSLYLHAY